MRRYPCCLHTCHLQSFLDRADSVAFYVDDRKADKYSHTCQRSWRGTYDIILLDHVSDFEMIQCVYNKNKDRFFRGFWHDGGYLTMPN